MQDTDAGHGWSAARSAIVGRLKQAQSSDIAMLSLLGGSVVWTAVCNYLGLLGLPGLGGEDAATSIYLMGVAVLCMAPIAIVLAFYLLPRWEEMLIPHPERSWIACLRPAVPALAFSCHRWIDPATVMIAGLGVLAAINAWIWSSGSGRARLAHAGPYLPLQVLGALLTIAWFATWLSIWLGVARFWFPTVPRWAELAVPIGASVAGWLVYVAIRLKGWLPALGAAILLLVTLGLSNPGYPAIMAGSLHMLNIGGGRMDLDASRNGPVLCDMGAFGRHYYILAPRKGCTLEGATGWIGNLRNRNGADRVAFLRANRVAVPAPAAAD